MKPSYYNGDIVAHQLALADKKDRPVSVPILCHDELPILPPPPRSPLPTVRALSSLRSRRILIAALLGTATIAALFAVASTLSTPIGVPAAATLGFLIARLERKVLP